MLKRKKGFLSIVTVLLLISVMFATSGFAAAKVKIRLATWAGVDEAKELQAILDKLNAKSNTYEIVQESNPADYQTKITTTLASQTGADLFWLAQESVPGLASKGVLMNITTRLKTAKQPAANTNDYFSASLERMTYQNKIYGLPWINQPVMLYCNLDLFDKSGLKYPDQTWDWNKFLAAAKALTMDTNGKHPDDKDFDPENIVQWGFTLNGWPPVQMFIWQAGGEVISRDYKTCPVDSPEAIAGARFYIDLLNKYHVTPPLSVIRDRGFDTMYKNRQVGMFMGGAADDLDYKPEFRSQAFMIPKGPSGKRFSFSWIGGMCVNAKTQHPTEAFQAFLDLSDSIHHWKVVPPRKSLATKKMLLELAPKKAHSLEAIIASLNDSRSFQIFPNYAEWDTNFWNEYVDPLLNARGTADELAKRVRPLLESTLSK